MKEHLIKVKKVALGNIIRVCTHFSHSVHTILHLVFVGVCICMCCVFWCMCWVHGVNGVVGAGRREGNAIHDTFTPSYLIHMMQIYEGNTLHTLSLYLNITQYFCSAHKNANIFPYRSR